MSKLILSIITTIIIVIPAKAQQPIVDSLYLQAYTEIADMLDGKKPLSVKRAVFLSEWAYLDGNLDYQKDFCNEITRIAQYIKDVIAINHFEKYKTAKQFSLCNYFFKPCNGNGKVPYTYDHNKDFPERDWHHQLVSRTLKSHKGQCHSLPMTFKLIAEELGAKAYIAKSPCHSYIMYKDEDDHYPEEWVNVEITSHQYIPSFAIKEHYQITDSAVIVGTYMTPLTDKQTIACQLADLAMSYIAKYPQFYDSFTLLCAEKSLEHFPLNPTAITIKGNSLNSLLMEHLQKNGGLKDDYTDKIDSQISNCVQLLKASHWTEVTKELDDQWSNEWKDAQKPITLTREMYNKIKNKQ